MAGANCGAAGQNADSWSPVNPDDHRIEGLGKFAVKTHNNHNGTRVVFVEVVSGSELLIEGYNLYALTLKVMEGNTSCSPKVLISESENVPPHLSLWMDSEKLEVYGKSWVPVEPDNTNVIIRLGRFAVKEHNSEAGTNIVFQKVVSGSQENGFDSIIFYALTLGVEDGQTPNPKVLISEFTSGDPTLLFWVN